MADKRPLIDALNAVLSWELAGTTQYLHHKAMLLGPEREHHANFFHEGSEEARAHAEIVADKIVALGGVPTVETATIRQATTLADMLKASLELEQDALAAWEAALDHGDLANRGTRFWLEERVQDEQDHVDELRRLTRSITLSTGESDDASDQQAG